MNIRTPALPAKNGSFNKKISQNRNREKNQTKKPPNTNSNDLTKPQIKQPFPRNRKNQKKKNGKKKENNRR